MSIFDDFEDVVVNGYQGGTVSVPSLEGVELPTDKRFLAFFLEDKDEVPLAKGKRFERTHRFLARCMELGCTSEQAYAAVWQFAPALDKEHDPNQEGSPGWIERNFSYEMAKIQAVHDHEGKSCRDALCPNMPRDDREQLTLAKALALKPKESNSPTSYANLGRIYNRAELARIPKPVPLIEGWVDLRTTGLLIGETGANKTFALIGWGCSVATGVPWLGHEVCVEPFPVIYVVGEGGSGLDSRIAAWETANGVTVPPEMLIVLMQPNSINQGEFWIELLSFAKEVGARLVILDTFSSLAPEADETKDAASIIRAMGELSNLIDGTVLLAHHTGWGNTDRARGGSQLEANPDSVIVLEKQSKDPDSPVSMYRKKAKDSKAGKSLWLRRVEVAGSCVMEICEGEQRLSKRGNGGAEVHNAKTLHARLSALLDNPDYELDENREFTKPVGMSVLMEIFEIKKSAAYYKWNELIKNKTVVEGDKPGRFRVGPPPS